MLRCINLACACTLRVCRAYTSRLPARAKIHSLSLRLGRDLLSVCESVRVGQRATEQGRALLSPCHRLVPLGVEGARVYACARTCVCVSERRGDAGGRAAESGT